MTRMYRITTQIVTSGEPGEVTDICEMESELEPAQASSYRLWEGYERSQSHLSAAMAQLDTLADYLKESHEAEYGTDHGGDGAAGCSYCMAIAEADTLQREVNGLPPRPVKMCNSCQSEQPIVEEDGEATCLLCGSDDIGLKSERNTAEIEGEVSELDPDDGHEHEALNAHFEHGQWWLTCGSCGASWSVVDVNESLDLERIDQGDESCPTTN